MKKERNSLHWFGETRLVRPILLAALLALIVVYFERACFIFNAFLIIVKPLVFGAAIAYVLNIVIKGLEKIIFPNTKLKWLKRSRRGICLALSMLLSFALLFLLVRMILPGLNEAFTLIMQEAPAYLEEVKAWARTQEQLSPTVKEQIENFAIDWPRVIEGLTAWASGGVGGFLSSTVSIIGSVSSGIFDLFMSVIFALFLLIGRDQLKYRRDRALRACFQKDNVRKINHVMATANRCFSGYITGQCVVAMILGALCALGMLVLGMPYATVVGAISCVTSFIPIIGGYIGAIVGAFLVFTVSAQQALIFLIFIIILQQLTGNILYPKLVGTSIGLPSVWVLAAVIIGGGIAGIWGMVIGVPLTATVYQLINERIDMELGEIESDDSDALTDLDTLPKND